MTQARARLDALPSAFPRLFRNGALAWGFETGDGWGALIELLCVRIDTILQGAPNVAFAVLQVKEKFGQLRFYYSISNASHEIAAAVELAVGAAEDASQHICERCAGRGQATDVKGWRMTLCRGCAKSLNAMGNEGKS